MNKFINAKSKKIDIMDAINHRLTKARSITSTLLGSNFDMTQISFQHLYGVIWTIDDFLEEIEQLSEKL